MRSCDLGKNVSSTALEIVVTREQLFGQVYTISERRSSETRTTGLCSAGLSCGDTVLGGFSGRFCRLSARHECQLEAGGIRGMAVEHATETADTAAEEIDNGIGGGSIRLHEPVKEVLHSMCERRRFAETDDARGTFEGMRAAANIPQCVLVRG